MNAYFLCVCVCVSHDFPLLSDDFPQNASRHQSTGRQKLWISLFVVKYHSETFIQLISIWIDLDHEHNSNANTIIQFRYSAQGMFRSFGLYFMIWNAVAKRTDNIDKLQNITFHKNMTAVSVFVYV